MWSKFITWHNLVAVLAMAALIAYAIKAYKDNLASDEEYTHFVSKVLAALIATILIIAYT